MNKTAFYAAAMIGALVTSSAAFAGLQDFTAVNRTGHTIMTMNVSASSDTEWGPDLLGSDVLPNGRSADVTFDRTDGECLWDIRVTYDDGDSNDLRQVNLCRVATVTFNP